MSLNNNHSGSNGKYASNFKMKKAVKDQMNGSWGSVGKWNGKIAMLLHVIVVVGLSWFLYGLIGWFSKSQNKSLFLGDFKNLVFNEPFDFGRHQLHLLSNQGTSVQANGSAEDACRSNCFWSTKTCWWVLFGLMVMSLRISCFRFSIWSKQQYSLAPRLNSQPQQLQQQQLMQHKLPLQIHSTAKTTTKWQKKLLFLFVVGMMVVSICIFYHFYQDTVFRRRETLANMCDERARMLQDQFNVGMNHVHALAVLVSTFHHGKNPSAMDQKTFEEYTDRTAFERPLTSGVAYALKVTHSEREKFEKRQGWTIKKMEHGDQTLVQDFDPAKMDPAPIQDEYAPVIFCQRTVAHIVSIDMMSGKEDRDNILRARATGKGVLTSPFKLLKSNHLGVVLTFAVYDHELPPDATPEQRITATMGYLGASYDLRSLVEKILQQLASKQTIVVNVYDTTNLSATINMYGTDVVDTGFLHVSSLDFGDPTRKHEMHCRFKNRPPPPWTAILSAGGVLTISLLLSHILHAAINRIVRVEEDCQKMTVLKARAEAADVAKSQFLATVSHEIRTPMNGVLGMLQMLMDTDLDADQLDYAQTAHASGKDLISIINEVLDQAKIESGRLELEAVPFDLRNILDNVVSLFSGKSREKEIELAIYVSNKVPEILVGDPGRFRQIITNLVGNSVKFTNAKGHIFVSVHLADEVKAPSDMMEKLTDGSERNTLSGYPIVDRWKSWTNFKQLSGKESTETSELIKLIVTVEDTGEGIPLEAQSRIFTPFMQADSSTSRHYGGTGIGLSISKCLVDLMGGEIGFVSERDIGSTFSFTAVLKRGELDSLDPKWHTHETSISELKGLRALVIDKRSIRAEVTRYHLQRLGISVDTVSSLQSAFSFVSDFPNTSALAPLAMILIDREVWEKEPVIEIRHLLENAVSKGSIDRMPKIFLLATSMTPSERSELKSSHLVDSIITKPLRLSVLTGCFHEAFGNGRKRQSNRVKPASLGSLLKGKLILVVDDNAVNRKVAEGALKKYGAVVTCVDSGKAAVMKLEPPHNFDACFMDLQMPEMDGFEATRLIRQKETEFNEKLKSGEVSVKSFPNMTPWHTPILAMTADVIQATNEECIKCGMDGYVSKPFEEEQLYSAVACFFESR
ncbi:histidine kinase 2-like [Chenopodium quinoa]|uniref:histidine kinase 2-like n=1 Tax=Chenopodium quinoa TaxID=63459 RepID=UPI000B790650|nr:histidine kinase 2-like [Chenopodium quinoa]